MSFVVGVFAQTIRRIDSRNDQLRYFQPVNEIIHHILEAGVVQIVAAVVHDHQGITPAAAETGRQIDPAAACAAQGRAAE